jgi:hypothetical protein
VWDSEHDMVIWCVDDFCTTLLHPDLIPDALTARAVPVATG